MLAAVWLYAQNELYRCNFCSENIERYRDGQRELHYVFVDMEKIHDRILKNGAVKFRSRREVCQNGE